MTQLAENAAFIEAKYKTVLPPGRKITLLVIHDMEMPDVEKTAFRCAEYFKHPDAPASAHYCIDDRNIVHCVQEKDVAFGAPGANHNGIHFEHAGYASQTIADWENLYNTEMLDLSARLVAERALVHKIPINWLQPVDLRMGMSGITSHRNITLGLHNGVGHTDPGPFFPVEMYIKLVRRYSNV